MHSICSALFPTSTKKTNSILFKEVSDLHTGYRTAPVILSGFLQWVSGVVLGIRDVGEDEDLCEEEAISIQMSDEVNHVQQTRAAKPWDEVRCVYVGKDIN
jgi:hypothetical protein